MPRQHLTPNACLVCRKKRTKCDGQMPCRRCRSRGEECVYEDKKWRTKDHLRSEIERLRAEQRQGHAVIRALVNNDAQQWEAVLARMHSDEPPDAIADWIHSTRSLPQTPQSPLNAPRNRFEGNRFESSRLDDTASGLPSTFQSTSSRVSESSASSNSLSSRLNLGSTSHSIGSSQGSWFDNASRSSFSTDISPACNFLSYRDFVAVPQSNFSSAPSDANIPQFSGGSAVLPLQEEPVLRAWTNVTSDTRLIQRLLNKFLSGSFPSFSLISAPQFMKDFREGTPRYCSEALVNAILGRACKFSDTTSSIISKVSYGDAFLGEARRLLAAEENHVNLPSIQALGLLALTEIGQGNDDEALKLAQESVRATIHLALQTQNQEHLYNQDFRAVRALAFCGGFSLIRLMRLLTGRLEPKGAPLFMRLEPDSGDLGEDAPEARVERGIALQMQFFAELQYCPPLVKFVFEVTETVHTFSSYHYSEATTAEDLKGAYDKCLDSYHRFTELFSPDLEAPPDLLFAQIWYRFCLLSLLRPFVKSPPSSKNGGEPPRLRDGAAPPVVCRESSEAIILLTSTYQTRFSLNQPPVLLPHMVFAAALYQLTLAAEPCQHHNQQRHLMDCPVLSQVPADTAAYAPSLAPSADDMSCCDPFTPRTTPSILRRPSLSSAHISSTELREPTAARHHGVSAVSSASPPPGRLSAAPVSRPSGTDAGSHSASSLEGELSSDDGASTSANSSENIGGPENTLPLLIPSDPADMVTIGSLQLASMAAQYPDAAEAVRLLRGFGSVRDLAGSGSDLGLLVASLPFPIPSSDFSAFTLLTGLGFQKPTIEDYHGVLMGAPVAAAGPGLALDGGLCHATSNSNPSLGVAAQQQTAFVV